MPTAKHIEMLRLLHSQTLKGVTAWETTAEDDVYLASFPSYGVAIRSWDASDGTGYSLQITNNEGSVVAELRAGDFEGPDLRVSEAYSLLKETFEGARRIAMGVDQAVDSILDNLRSQQAA
ncbi:MAG TPA: hypothetical protein VGN26_02890 [Armatimonadota bacterium]|jgi:hypothetical protein